MVSVHIKKFKTIKKLWHTQEFGLEIRSGQVTRKKQQQRNTYRPYLCLYQISLKYFKQLRSY